MTSSLAHRRKINNQISVCIHSSDCVEKNWHKLLREHVVKQITLTITRPWETAKERGEGKTFFLPQDVTVGYFIVSPSPSITTTGTLLASARLFVPINLRPFSSRPPLRSLRSTRHRYKWPAQQSLETLSLLHSAAKRERETLTQFTESTKKNTENRFSEKFQDKHHQQSGWSRRGHSELIHFIEATLCPLSLLSSSSLSLEKTVSPFTLDWVHRILSRLKHCNEFSKL